MHWPVNIVSNVDWASLSYALLNLQNQTMRRKSIHIAIYVSLVKNNKYMYILIIMWKNILRNLWLWLTLSICLLFHALCNSILDACNERLVSGASGISDDHITASSYYRDIIHDDSPHCARLNQTRSTCHGWSPIRANKKQWIQVTSFILQF
jgi:hypothetical protein